MKLGKEYFADSKNGKHMEKGQLHTFLSKHCKMWLGGDITDGSFYIVDSDLDGRWFLKIDKGVEDFSKVGPNVWVSRFSKILKIHNVLDRTTYFIYKKD